MFKYVAVLLMVVSWMACTRQEVQQETLHAPFLTEDMTWVDSLVLTMSLDEKIGQLLIYQPTIQDTLDQSQLINLVTNQQISGLILEGLPITEYVQLIDSLQGLARVPLFNGSRQQVSINNQFSGLTHLPSAATISSITDDSLRQLITTALSEQLNYLGFNICFTPSLNSNYDSPTFDFQTFESEPEAIMIRSSKVLHAAKDQKLLSFAGSFKEFIDVSQDTTRRPDSLMRKYNNVVQNGVSGLLVDPSIFQIDTLPLLPPSFLKTYLKEKVEFDGLLVADWNDEPFDHLFHAGIDLVVIRDSLQDHFNQIRRLIEQEQIAIESLNERVEKILQAKSWLGLDTILPKVDQELALDIMSAGFDDYEIRRMYEQGLTLVNNPQQLLPFVKTYRQPFRLIQVGQPEMERFQQDFSKYASYSLSQQSLTDSGTYEPIDFHQFQRATVILTVAGVDLDSQRDSLFIRSVNDLGKTTRVTMVNFGNPKNFIHFDSTIAMVQQYDLNELTESFAAQLLFGALQAPGKLPLALDHRFPFRHGIDTTAIIRMKYTVPEEVGIAAYQLVGIDAIARSAIRDKTTPGCQILVAKEGKIIYSKSFGKQSFDGGRLVQQSDIYDLASITKVASTTLGIMKLYDQDLIELNQPLKSFIELGEDSKLKNIKLKELLMHQSGLQSNMPIARYIMYKDTTGTGCSDFFCKEKKLSYVTQVADSLYMDFKYQDSIWQKVYELSPRKRKRYRYSDVNFNLLMKVLESRTGKDLENYNKNTFYQPMNLSRLTYTPLKYFKRRDIVPTTKEERFRNQLIHGYVHDESAALLGGVGGNAGLFGNAESLAPLFQMLLNEGTYGGVTYLSPKTVKTFTKKQRGTRRGLGFDVNTKNGTNACSPQASPETFGHTGFTGTCVWVDPETELVFIFLSNRINPSVKNRSLFRKKIRSRIHTLVYDALNTYPEQPHIDTSEKEEIVRATVQ